MSVSEGKTEQARWETSSNIPITDCRGLGTYNRNRKRTVRITFLFMKHKTCLFSRKSKLPDSIYIDEAYPESIKQKRYLLRPILKLAKTKEEFKGHCKLDKDHLIIKGKHYMMDTLKNLPEELAPYKTAQRTTETCLVFQGIYCPLSNFHQSPFSINVQIFNTAEHLIQYKKACQFNDYETSEKIRQCTDPHEAKTLSRNIDKFNRDAWKDIAKDAYYPGIKAKFEQNTMLLQFLKSTWPLRLAESSYDSFWGTGIPLNDLHSTYPTYWKTKGY